MEQHPKTKHKSANFLFKSENHHKIKKREEETFQLYIQVISQTDQISSSHFLLRPLKQRSDETQVDLIDSSEARSAQAAATDHH